MARDLFERISSRTTPRQRAVGATPRSVTNARRASGFVERDDGEPPSTRTKKKLGPSVSIVGDGANDEVVSKNVPVSASRRRALRERDANAKIHGDDEHAATREGKERAEDASRTETSGDTSGDLMHDPERSVTSENDVESESEAATVPVERRPGARKTTRTPADVSRFDENGGFEALARGIDALSPIERAPKGKRLSFSNIATQAPSPSVSDTVSFGSVGESFDITAEEEPEIEQGTFPPCECASDNCVLAGMHARGGPFALPKRVRELSIAEEDIIESIAETDVDETIEESVEGTEVGDVAELEDAMEALDLFDEDEQFTAAGEIEEEATAVQPRPTGTHIRFEDSVVIDSPEEAPESSSEDLRPRARSRRKAILESDDDEHGEDDSNASDGTGVRNEDVNTESEPIVSSRPRRAASRNLFVKRSAFVDDDLSGSEDDFEDEEEQESDDDDFIDDGDEIYGSSDDEYPAQYDSDAENVTPAPRMVPTTGADLTKELNEKLVIDEYSPSNLHTPTPPKELSPTSAVKAFRPPPSHSKALQSALKSVTKKGADKFNFNRHKDVLTAALFEEFNASVFDDALPADFEVSWNKKLLTTAGLTHYKRSSKTGETVYSARIELSTKVLDTVEKLEATLLHEMCHASSWLIDKTAKPPHGPVFKKWAARAMKTYPETNVSTCHAYAIHQPYKWRCTRDWCQQEYGRHSKSIDITKKACGSCGGTLEYLGKFKKNGEEVQERAPTAFSLFVKENFKAAKDALGAATPHKDVMKHLSERWKDQSGNGNVIQLDDE
ncbi:SPRT-like metalloprotease [Ostreococcus tauri]|uniref:SPRT-like metalloprotease n=1 Tax=Ostreococcus tauri TaxID=70448 RepID=A0A1Y5HZ98_OSTTA|nr:SPRT-like metalloprotease [Ostreococcus tauri]